MPLTAERNTPMRDGALLSCGVAGSTKIFAGALVALAAGFATKGAASVGLVAMGRAEETVDNTDGSDGDLSIKIRPGVFQFANSSSTDEITAASIGFPCFIVDDQTVAKTDGGATRSRAGIVVDVDAAGVWVEVGPGVLSGRKCYLQVLVSDVVGANAKVFRVVSPVSGKVTKLTSILQIAALTTADATLTGKIGGVAITTGVITITQSGSAAGDIDTATPTAANTVSAGQEISITVGGGNAAATSQVSVLIEITY
jgi:hypothetical protein